MLPKSFKPLLLAMLTLGIVAAARGQQISSNAPLRELTVSPCGEVGLRITVRPLGGAPTGDEPPVNPALLDRPWAKPVLWLKTGETAPTTRIGKLLVTIQGDPWIVRLTDTETNPMPALQFERTTSRMSFSTGIAPVLGLGEGGQQFNRLRAFYPMKSSAGAWDRPKYGSCNAVPFLIGTPGWGLFVLSPGGQFDLKEEWGVFLPAQTNGAVDVLVFDAHEPAAMFKDLVYLTGQPAMPPKWALGYMQSHRTLEDSKQMLEIADTFRAKKLPCDAVIYLGTGFCPQGWNVGHDSFAFNPKVFVRSPAAVFQDFHDRHFEVVLHVVPPKVQLHGDIPPLPGEVLDASHIANYWQRHLPVLNAGVDGWWPDEGDWMDVPARLARHRMYYEGSLAERPNQRPWSLHRNGYLGMARYGAWLWSGDIDSRWSTLAAQISVGLNASLSVTPYWGTDTGGFFTTKELTGELYTRWFQFSTFCPLFRSHGRTWQLRLPWGWNTGKTGPVEFTNAPDESELHNAAVEPICRDYLDLRYRLLPYNYTLAREAHDTGMPLMRALWLHYPKDPNIAAEGGEYLWGRDILVAPVVEKGANSRVVYLPKGDWYDWWTNQRITGGKNFRREVDLATMPLYVRAGAIIPLDPVRQYVDEPVTEPTTLQIYSGADGQFTLYDDDGKTQEYLRGQGTWTVLAWTESARRLVIEPRADSAANSPAKRAFKIRLIPEGIERTVEYNGRRLEVSLAN